MSKTFTTLALFTLLAIQPLPALAQAAGTVTALNPPAFLVRDGITRALDAGTELRAGDLLRTGDDARLLLRMAEGSDVKLGAGAEFRIDEFEQRSDGVFGGLLNVLRGAFRFTTTLLSERNQRDLQVQVSTVTAGIRGTDLWGRSNDEADLVCLIEGAVSVRHRDGEAQLMSDPLTFFVAPRGEPPQPIGPVDPDRLVQWASETELLDGEGVVRAGGDYMLHLVSLRDAASAQALRERLDTAGYAAGVSQAEVDDTLWHRVSLHGFASAAEARATGERLGSAFDLPTGWVQRQ